MKLNILLIVTISFLPISSLFGQSSSSNQQLLNILKKSDIGTNAVKYSVEIAKTAYNDNQKLLANDINKIHPNIKNYNASFQKTISGVKSQADRDKVIFKSVEFGNSVIMSPVYSVPVIGNIMKEVNNQIFDAAENDLKRNYEKKLAYSLEDLRKKNQAKYNDIIQSKDYDEVKNALDEVNFFSNETYEGMDEFKEVITASKEKFVKESVNTTLKRILDDVGNQNIDIDDVNQKINNLSQFTYKFAEESNERFKKLVTVQEELNTKVDSFIKNYKEKDKKVLDFMQGFMYSKMNTKEKINALNSDLFPDMSEEEKAIQIEELKIIEKREDVIYSAQEFLNSAAISKKIANDLGLGNSPLVQNLSTAINYGQAASTAVTSFMSGNYLQAISSITGLFGGGGPDIAEQRHQQIMERFDRIDGKLKQIDQKLNDLIEGQKAIIENQQRTFEFLVDFAKNVDQQHNEVMNELKTIENAVYFNRLLLKNEWEVKRQACRDIIITRLNLDVDKDIFPNYSLLKQGLSDIKEPGGPLQLCQEYVSRYRIKVGEYVTNPDFYLEGFIENNEQASNIKSLISLYEKSFNLLKNSDEYKKSDKNKLIIGLLYPSANANELENKFYSTDYITKDNSYKNFTSEYLLKLINPQIVVEHGHITRNMNFLASMIKEGQLITWEDLSKKDFTLGRRLLEMKDAAVLNNIAIAQQTLLSGDVLLPIMYNILELKKNDGSSKPISDLSKDVLSNNATLATNFVNYYFFKKTKSASLNLSQYSYIYNSKDNVLFNNVVLPVFPVEYIHPSDDRINTYKLTEGWHMIISDIPYKIPAPSIVNTIPLVQTKSLPTLIGNRNELYRQLKSYNVYEGLSSDQIENLNYMIMKTQD